MSFARQIDLIEYSEAGASYQMPTGRVIFIDRARGFGFIA
jgi:hypothetical protein